MSIILSSILVSLERQCWAYAQFLKRKYLNILGIPREVSAKVLEEKVLNIFDKIRCSISPDHIESYHGISKKSDYFYVFSAKRLPTNLAGQKRSAEIENRRT